MMMKSGLLLFYAVVMSIALLATGIVSGARAGEGDQTAAVKTQNVEQPVSKVAVKPVSPANQYCMNVREPAESAQIAQERKNLAKAQRDVEERINILAAKTAEYQQWLKKRDDFLKQANEGLVEIYSKIKPDVAAAQMTVMNEGVAAAIIAKMPPKTAGLILGEMDAAHAVKLSSYLAGAGEIMERQSSRDEGRK